MFGKEFMEYLNSADKASSKKDEPKKNSCYVKSMSYLILKCGISDKK